MWPALYEFIFLAPNKNDRIIYLASFFVCFRFCLSLLRSFFCSSFSIIISLFSPSRASLRTTPPPLLVSILHTPPTLFLSQFFSLFLPCHPPSSIVHRFPYFNHRNSFVPHTETIVANCEIFYEIWDIHIQFMERIVWVFECGHLRRRINWVTIAENAVPINGIEIYVIRIHRSQYPNHAVLFMILLKFAYISKIKLWRYSIIYVAYIRERGCVPQRFYEKLSE